MSWTSRGSSYAAARDRSFSPSLTLRPSGIASSRAISAPARTGESKSTRLPGQVRPEQSAMGRNVVRQHGHSRGHRLQQRQPETLAGTRERGEVGGREEASEFLVRVGAMEADSLSDAELSGDLLEPGPLGRLFGPRDPQFPLRLLHGRDCFQ